YIKECEEECYALCKKGLYLPAYDNTMKLSQYFNMLEARGAISVQDRTNNITKIRNLAKACAKAYVEAANAALKPAAHGTDATNANAREGHSTPAPVKLAVEGKKEEVK
ncbi:MAG: glycine--tRNA ligase subunit alpha, partial [Elusimicrobiaceae bacterium]|nr:glycine--tRNA ligase subunit alpha [Elusimicrobiaceae bacterium]